jgi:hypothetical protein
MLVPISIPAGVGGRIAILIALKPTRAAAALNAARFARPRGRVELPKS